MAITIIDPAKGKAPKLYKVYDEVDELDMAGRPTGRKIRIKKHPMAEEIGEEREAWLVKRLKELETEQVDELGSDGVTPTGRKLTAAQVTVIRGSADDVIGITVTYKVVE